ncbi:roundabout homolog 1 isoform X1, partial [Paramuricea clavata]
EGALEIIDATESDSQFDGDEIFELHCCFYSHPYCPTITWYKDGVEIKDDHLTIRKIRQGLTLKVFAKLDAGGNYTCNATTPYGEVKSNTIRNVQVI